MLKCLNRGGAFYRNVVALAVPIILQNLVTTSLGLIDTFMVGSLGEAELAAVSVANIPVFVIQLVIFGLQSGSSVLISQFWGKGDQESISRVIGVGFAVAGCLSALFALVMVFFPVPLMGMLTSDPALVDIAADYARIVGPAFLLNSLTGVYVGAHRSMENPGLGLKIFTASMCTNTFLNWVFIFGNLGAPRLGVVGAAAATFASRVVEFVIMAVYAAKNRRFRLDMGKVLRPGRALAAKFARYSGPVVLNETLWGLGTSLFKVIMGHMEGQKEILAARALAGNVEDLCAVVIFATGGTAAIIVGREIGAGRDRETVYQVGAAMNVLAVLGGAAVGLVMLVGTRVLLAPVVYPLLHLSPRAEEIATTMLTFTGVCLPLRAFNNTNTVGVLRGGGDVRAASVIDLVPLWLVALPLAALFGLGLQWGIFWVCVGASMEQVAKFGIGVARFRSRAWINDVTLVGK